MKRPRAAASAASAAAAASASTSAAASGPSSSSSSAAASATAAAVQHREPDAAPEAETKAPPVKKPAKKLAKQQTYIYGNYRNYYGYRIEKGQEEDPRLAVFRKEWFEGKECLDIGCNQGLITLAIAKKFSCRGILGIDIDKVLIGDANRNLHGETSDLSSDNHKEDSLVNRVFFREENFVENFHKCSEKYDTILCLSVTKWIHLNCGDDGLITLFVKIWRCLRPGGVLLLEPQPWSSYMKKRKVSDNTNENYWRLEIRPHNFREILLDKIGFRSAEVVTKNLSGSAKGFDRPIIAYYK